MMTRILIRLAIFGLFMLIITSLLSAVSAANTVPGSRLTNQAFTINADALKPAECAALNLTNIVVGSGTITGTGQNDLILGGPLDDTIRGNGGDDCILGGGGNDNIRGGGGADVCIGGPGTDTFTSCKTSYQ